MAQQQRKPGKNNALDPRKYETGDIDTSIWDADPKMTKRFGSQTQEIRRMLQPFLKKVLGDGDQEYDVAFFTEKDMLSSPDWRHIPFGWLTNNDAWDPNHAIRFCLQDYKGALVWRGYVSGEPHFVCVQRMDYRKKKQQQFYKERQRRLEMTAPESVGGDAVMREAITTTETKVNVPLVSTDTETETAL